MGFSFWLLLYLVLYVDINLMAYADVADIMELCIWMVVDESQRILSKMYLCLKVI